MDTLFLHGLRFEAVIGANAWERRIRQRIELDVDLDYDADPAAARDDLHQALDYWLIFNRLKQFVEASEYSLVETLAEALAALILKEFKVTRVALSVVKPAIVQAQARVGVRIERRASGKS